MTEQSTVESYDEMAEKWSERMSRGRSSAHELLEKPAMYSKLPDLQGKSVLCVGCGSGEECDYIKKLGADRVVGIDISKGLIEQAKYKYPEVEFIAMDMERMDFEGGTFDFVFSSLVLHYVEDWSPTLKNVFRVLRPGGRFLFSEHHPVKWGAESRKENGEQTNLLGYKRLDSGEVEIYGDYLNVRKIDGQLMDGLKVQYYHKPISQAVKEILETGFEIRDFLEPRPVPEAKKEREDWFEIHNRIPLFMIFELERSRIRQESGIISTRLVKVKNQI